MPNLSLWKKGEFDYCLNLVKSRGNSSVGTSPQIIAQYLRLQSSDAFWRHEYEISARLATAATCISESADNNHTPAWERAELALSIS